jgi:hypothetical protein
MNTRETFRIADYYSHPAVRERMLDFLGGESAATATCVYLTAGDIENPRHREPLPPDEIERCWAEGRDISRSLWDRNRLIAHLDIEYVNFDHPDEPYTEPARAFELQKPVEMAILATLADFGIEPLHLLSGRGHHFAWCIPQGSEAYHQLIGLGSLQPSLEALYARPHRPRDETLPAPLGMAHAGLGLVIEYLGHRVRQASAPVAHVPVEFTAVEVGPGIRGREMLSIDLSEYGDPLTSRVIRVPFSLYLKPWQQRALLGESTVASLPPSFLIPLTNLDTREGLRVMHQLAAVLDLARSASTRIPDQSAGMSRLIREYSTSDLAGFHKDFHAIEQDPPSAWPHTYDQTPMDPLPQCARFILDHPNDLLLRPANLRRVVRVMMALGWHPRHIAGLIRSKFERDHGWGGLWRGYDPALRADFYTHLFAGQIVTGQDDLVDFNCRSAREQQLCYLDHCNDNLERFKASLHHRRNHERLACRPFNRLLLPQEPV